MNHFATFLGATPNRFSGIAGMALLVAVAAASLPAQTFTALASFNGNNGALPQNESGSAIVQGPDGNFYGSTAYGGPDDAGVIFKMTPAGTLTSLYNFTFGANGTGPLTGVIVGADGNLYGANGSGIFKLTLGGAFTVLSSSLPALNVSNGLVQASDGNFYATTFTNDDATRYGVVFRVTPAGALTVLYTFAPPNGAYPEAPLIQGTDGNLYGTTSAGGPSNAPLAFKITTGGGFSVVADLTFGYLPQTALLQATDGNFYGVAPGKNLVFKMTPQGTVTTLYTFCSVNTSIQCQDGTNPQGALIQGKDGNLYGTTGGGGSYFSNGGTIFQLTLAGKLTTLYSFCPQFPCTDGMNPQGTLYQTSDGTLYGTTMSGGTSNQGVVFSLKPPAAPPYTCTNTAPVTVSFIDSASAYGGYSYFASGSWLEIKGANLADPKDPRLASGSGQWATADFNGPNAPTNLDGISVSIDNKPAYVWYLSPTQINVQAPEDSTNGNVAITVTNCKATSSITMFSRRNLAPGLLAPPNYSSSGTQYLVATFASDGAYVLNTSLGASFGLNSRPAKPGDLIVAYGIGFGDVTPAILPGVVVGQSNALVNPVTFSFGSTPATLAYAGLAGSFIGLYEFYINVPQGLANGDYQINVAQNGTTVPQTMYLTVHN